MAKASKPVALIKESSKLTKQEIKDRLEQEAKLKGNDNLVYEIPQNLSNKEQKIYEFLITELQPSGILNNLDMVILETTANAIAMMEDCKALIKKHGLIKVSDSGALIRNPASIIYKDYVNIFNKCCMELGMSPSARAKLGNINLQDKQKKEDPLLLLLGGGKK